MTICHFSIFVTSSHSFIFRSGEALPSSSGKLPEGKNKNTLPKNPDVSPRDSKSLDAQAVVREANKVKEAQAELHVIAVRSNLMRDIQLLPNQTYRSADLLQMKRKMMDAMETIRDCLAPAQIEHLEKYTLYLHPGKVFTVSDKSFISSDKGWLVLLDCFDKSSHEITVEILDRLNLTPPLAPKQLERNDLSEKQQLQKELRDVASSYGANDIRLWDDEKYDINDVRQNQKKIQNVFSKIATYNGRDAHDPSAAFRALPLVPIYLNPGSIFRSIGIKEGYHSTYKGIAIDYTESDDEILDDIRRGLADFVKTLSPAELDNRLDKKYAYDRELKKPHERRHLFESIQDLAKKSRVEREKKQFDVSLVDGHKLAQDILLSKKLVLPTLRADMLAISNVFYISSGDSWKPLSPPQPGIETAERKGVHFFRIRTKSGDRYVMRKDNSWVEPIVSQRDLDKFQGMTRQLSMMLNPLILASGRGLHVSQFEFNPIYPGCLMAKVDLEANSIEASAADSELRFKIKTHPNFFANQQGVVGSLDTETIKKLRPTRR